GFYLGDAVLLKDGTIALYAVDTDGNLFEKCGDAESSKVTEETRRPSVFIDKSGKRHIAFERDRRIFYIASNDGKTWEDTKGNANAEMVAYFCSSWPSIAVAGNGKIVIAYQGEGKVDLRAMPELYNKVRHGAGCAVSYVVYDGEKWKVYDHQRSKEIMLHRRGKASLPNPMTDKLFITHMEEFWMPTLAVDKYGVVWMFYNNSTRRHVFMTRFLGDKFDSRYEAKGPLDCLRRVCMVMKESRNQSRIGLMVHAANRMYFDTIEVPEYKSTEKRKVVFLDNMEVEVIKGVDHKLGKWEKRPEPVNIEGDFKEVTDKYLQWCDVKNTGDGFTMDYMSQTENRNCTLTGRLSSKDGINWQKEESVSVDDITLDGEPLPRKFWQPLYLEDIDEKDPERRYKGLLAFWRHIDGIEVRFYEVVVSPDGKNWKKVKGLDDIVQGDISVPFHLLRDDEDKNPKRRYKFMALMSSNSGRGVTVYTSPDMIHWDKPVYLRADPENEKSESSPVATGPLIIDPDACESPWEEENHDSNIFRENGLMMAHYDAFYFHHNQHINKALAVSRDGKHYWRVKCGENTMLHGNVGEWDSGRDRTADPIRVGDELWMYYCGMPASYFGDPEKFDITCDGWNHPPAAKFLRPWQVGVAKMRVDGWAYFEKTRGAEDSEIVTIPFSYEGGDLEINAAGLSGLQVEVLDAESCEVVTGFEKEKSSFNSDNSVSEKALWEGNPELKEGNYRLRFTISDYETKLYSFGFSKED
ncbi:MAG: hypothetical protein ACYTFY_12730, partial [Planctomycetota bacterium]